MDRVSTTNEVRYTKQNCMFCIFQLNSIVIILTSRKSIKSVGDIKSSSSVTCVSYKAY